MNNKLNRYYRKIRTILEIDPKTIHKELVTAFKSNAPSYTTVPRWAKRFRKRREDINDHPVDYPNLQMKIFNWFDKLSAMINIQLMMKL